MLIRATRVRLRKHKSITPIPFNEISTMQVWSGNEDCKPVSWEECTKEKYPAKFEKDTVNCTAGNPMPYCNSCKTVWRDIMTVNYICEPKASLKCETVTTRSCVNG